MALLHIPLDQIKEKHLQTIRASGAWESRTIEYKRTSYGNADDDYLEFLADISSFANASGGDLVLGIDATNGIPTAINSANCRRRHSWCPIRNCRLSPFLADISNGKKAPNDGGA